MHVACGNLTDIRLEGERLIVKVEENMIYNLLNDGKRELESALRWQGLGLNLEIEYSPQEKFEEIDIEKLKSIFGDKLTIKG